MAVHRGARTGRGRLREHRPPLRDAVRLLDGRAIRSVAGGESAPHLPAKRRRLVADPLPAVEPTDGPRAEANPFAFHNATRLEGQLSLGVVSVRAGINPLEILDFLLGFLGFDIAGDDPPRGEKGDESHAENAESAE